MISVFNGARTPDTALKVLALSFSLATISIDGAVADQGATEPNQVPVEAFAAPESFDRPLLSPNGQKLAYFVEKDGRTHLLFRDVDGKNVGLIPPSGEADLYSFFWANDTILMLQFIEDVDRWFYNDTVVETRFFSFNVETKEVVWLGNPARRKSRGISGDGMSSRIERLVDRLPQDPDHVLMQFDFDRTGSPEVYKVKVQSGKRNKVQAGRSHVYRWYADQSSTVRLGLGIKNDRRHAIYRFLDGSWETITGSLWYDTYEVIGFAETPEEVYVANRWAEGKSGLHKLNVLTGNIVETLSHPDGTSIAGFVYHPTNHTIIGKKILGNHIRDVYFDPKFAQIQRVVDKALAGYVNRIVSKAANEEKYLVHSYASNDPGEFFLLDGKKGSMDFVASNRDPIDPALMSKTTSHQITMRDGALIEVFLTRPAHANGGAIVMPHGGPYGTRSDADWQYDVQFFASRGYTVVQPNFRGSGGYGNAFERAGYNQWGGLMQDDITDTTNWLITEDLADQGRICIVGGSYGGYAALMGTIKEQGLYRCAISLNGATDLPWMKNNDEFMANKEEWLGKLGLSGVPDEQVSPYDQAATISAPVLLVAAKDDMRIPYEMTRDLHNRLKKLGKPSSYLKIDKGGHGLWRYEARLAYLKAAEDFLNQHIGSHK